MEEILLEGQSAAEGDSDAIEQLQKMRHSHVMSHVFSKYTYINYHYR